MPNNEWLINNAILFQFWPQSESLLPGLSDEFGPLLLVARIMDWFKLELVGTQRKSPGPVVMG